MLLHARADRHNDHGLAGLHQRLNHPGLRVISLASNDRVCLHSLEQHVSAFKAMRLPGHEVKTPWIARCIDRGVDFGRQVATAVTDRLAWFKSLFLAPALRWRVRTMVESIMQCSLSASRASLSKTRCQMPHLLQPEWRRCTTRNSPKRSDVGFLMRFR